MAAATDPAAGLAIRRLEPHDSFAELTGLLHRAYAPLLAMGLRFMATHQDEETTRRRAAEGECWVLAGPGGRLWATVTLRPPGASRGTPWYERPDVAVFGQFAVEPERQRHGLGGRLLRHVEGRALELGAAEIACDTSVEARHLIAYYERRGYRRVGDARWPDVNYSSVILSKSLDDRRRSSR